MNIPSSWKGFILVLVHIVLLLDNGDEHGPPGGGLLVAAVLLPLKLARNHYSKRDHI